MKDLFDASKSWIDASDRIALHRDQVHQKKADFRMMNSDKEGRDLKQVEEELSDSNRKKDDYNGTIFFNCNFSIKRFLHNPEILSFSVKNTRNCEIEKITKLNLELSSINDRVTHFSTIATSLENEYKKKELKYEEQLKLEERASELREKFAERKHEQDKVSHGGFKIDLFAICNIFFFSSRYFFLTIDFA